MKSLAIKSQRLLVMVLRGQLCRGFEVGISAPGRWHGRSLPNLRISWVCLVQQGKIVIRRSSVAGALVIARQGGESIRLSRIQQ